MSCGNCESERAASCAVLPREVDRAASQSVDADLESDVTNAGNAPTVRERDCLPRQDVAWEALNHECNEQQRRRQTHLGNLTPVEFEAIMNSPAAEAA